MPVMVFHANMRQYGCVKFQLNDASFIMENNAVYSENCCKKKKKMKLSSDSIVQFNVPKHWSL